MQTILESKTKTVIIGDDVPFVMIGEKINPSGRKKLGAEMAEGNFERVRNDALAQVNCGAHMLDVNAGYPMGDEPAMRGWAAELVERKPNMLVAVSRPASIAARRATASIPIVFSVVPDPVDVLMGSNSFSARAAPATGNNHR